MALGTGSAARDGNGAAPPQLPTMPSSFRKAALRHTLRVTAALLAALVAVFVYVAWVGISLDTSVLRGRTASWLSQQLGREVRLDGPLQIQISARPSLVVHDVHLANAAGFDGAELAGLGEARLALDLWSLFGLHLRVEEISGRAARIHLQTDGHGANNWTFPSPPAAAQAPQSPADASDRGNAVAKLLAALDIRRVSIEDLEVEFRSGGTTRHDFELQSLVAQFPAGQALSLSLQGKVEQAFPYRLDLAGGSLADLAHPENPWPVDLRLVFLSSHLSLNGSVSAQSGTLQLDLGTQDLAEFDRLLQTRLPAVGAVELAAVVAYGPGQLGLHELKGHLGQTVLRGTLDVDHGGPRPRITGALDLPVLDLRPFLTAGPPDKTEPPKDFAEVYREISKATFHLNDLKAFDADLALQVGQWLSLPGSVRDAALRVQLERGQLDVQVHATVAQVALAGSAHADANATPPQFHLGLGTRDSPLGNLAELLLGLPDVQGKLGALDLRVAARGDSGLELMQSLDLRLDVQRGDLSYGNGAGHRPVRFTLDRLALALPAGRPAQGEAQGSLLGTPVRATLHAGSLMQTMQEVRAPVDLELQAGSARAAIQAVLQRAGEDKESTAAFHLDAPHSAEIADWLGLQRGADAPVRLQGELHVTGAGWHLAGFALHLGRSDLNADVARTSAADRPLLQARVSSTLLDADELQSLLPQRSAPAAAAPPAATNLIDIPILPQGISLADADLDVQVARVASAVPLALRALHFEGRIRDGVLSAAPFSAEVLDTAFRGTLDLDLRSSEPRTALTLATDGLDIGKLLARLDIARQVDAGVEHLRLRMDLHASRLGSLLAQSELAVEFDGGHLDLHDANTGASRRIALDSGTLRCAAGAPVRLGLRGSLDAIPVSIDIQTARAVDLINPALPVPFRLQAEASATRLVLSGEVERPFSGKEIEVALDVQGERLDSLDRLTHTALPPWGPWSIAGQLHVSDRGYDLPSLRLQVGSSRLEGQGRFDTKIVPPRLDVALAAPQIQIDDFRLGDWSPETAPDKPRQDAAGKRPSLSDIEADVGKGGDQVQQVLSPSVLQRQNAYLNVTVDQVLSGTDRLGSGSLEAKLEGGRIAIGPLVVNLPGGSATLRFGYAPDDGGVGVRLRALVNRFDYGVLARRIDPASDMRGTFSLDMDVSARARRVSELLRYGKGRIDFAVWPQNQKSGLLDLWAVNVLMALLPAVDPASESKINCAVARFDLTDGKLSEKTILIDTTRMRVTGKGGVDFGAQDVQFYVQPRAKTPQFLSFALPIELSGKVDDFHVGVRAADVLETVLQLATSVLRVPMQILFEKETPADGRDVCAVEFK
jgi:uncharacterized protein involved in outer membrane biogenesis